MYKAYFHLARNPFELTPDPIPLFDAAAQRSAGGAYHGIRRHKGFVVVTGEVGTGKTLLLRCLLQQLQESKDIIMHTSSTAGLCPTEFLQYMFLISGSPPPGRTKATVCLTWVTSWSRGVEKTDYGTHPR